MFNFIDYSNTLLNYEKKKKVLLYLNTLNGRFVDKPELPFQT